MSQDIQFILGHEHPMFKRVGVVLQTIEARLAAIEAAVAALEERQKIKVPKA